MQEIKNIIASWKLAEQPQSASVLATVVQVEGSHYRRPGARMLVVPSAPPVGSVSGGCLESDVMQHASEVIRTGKPCVIHYDSTTESDLVFGTGTGCGGAVDILLEPAMGAGVRQLMHYFEECINERRALAIGTVFAISSNGGIAIGDKAILIGDRAEFIGIDDQSIRLEIGQELHRTIDTKLGSVQRLQALQGTVEMLFEYLEPPTALALFGAGDDAIPVCRMASDLGWQVTIVDQRSNRVTSDRFPQAAFLKTSPYNSVASAMKLNEYDAAVVMTHNYESDVELLSSLFNSTILYIGLLGASKRAERILNEITRRGMHIDEGISSRLHAPVGLDIGAEGADEIALAIVAEIQMVLSGSTGRPLRLRGQSHTHETFREKPNE